MPVEKRAWVGHWTCITYKRIPRVSGTQSSACAPEARATKLPVATLRLKVSLLSEDQARLQRHEICPRCLPETESRGPGCSCPSSRTGMLSCGKQDNSNRPASFLHCCFKQCMSKYRLIWFDHQVDKCPRLIQKNYSVEKCGFPVWWYYVHGSQYERLWKASSPKWTMF